MSTSAVRHSFPGASHLLRHQRRMLSRTREAGFDGHLVKPVNYSDLVALLGSFSQLS